ncbi:hypothetical protein AB0O91_16930 [Kitasatospora sp. NPDC089797]|uniref:hypothetical protein n=1 Tax=Kitasatospora sp. NPDC089797 TaxID=3155298 RepID=UPI003414F1C5
MELVRRAAAAGCTLALALGGAVALAPAAHATPEACFAHVAYYTKVPDWQAVKDACRIGAAGTEEAFQECTGIMEHDYVSAGLAAEACRLAPKPFVPPRRQ